MKKRSTFEKPRRLRKFKMLECPVCGAAPGKACVSVIDRRSEVIHTGREIQIELSS